RVADERERAAGRCGEVLAPQGSSGARHAADRECVPRSEDLLVARRRNASAANREQFCTRGIDQPFDLGRGLAENRCDLFDGGEGVQMPLALEVRCALESEAWRECGVLLGRERALDLCAFPNVVLALVALGVRIEAREVSSR